MSDSIRRDGSVVVVIPTLNEAEAIGAVIKEMRFVDRIIVADGGSTDGTQVIASAAGAEVIDAGPGYGRACLAGAKHAEAFDVVVFMDGDGADDPAQIERLVAPIRAGTQDFVIGSRVRGRRDRGAMLWRQIAAGLAVGWAMRLRYGVRYSDMCAFRALRRDTLLSLGMRELTYGWNLEMQMRAAQAGLRILELPVPCRRRAGGVSKVSGSLRGTLSAGWRILTTFARIASASERNTAPFRGSKG